MVRSSPVNYAIDTLQKTWKVEPYRDTRVPLLEENSKPIAVKALWTDKSLRPNFNNLAFVIQDCQNNDEFYTWKQRLASFPVRGSLLVTSDSYYLQYYNQFGELEGQEVKPDELVDCLNSSKSNLFAPKKLSEFRSGQLSLADLEDCVSERSFSLILKQRRQLDSAFESAIKSAFSQIRKAKNINVETKQVKGHIIKLAIAFLSARILEDKGFFGSIEPTNHPKELLDKTVVSLNHNFFSNAINSISFIEEFLPQQSHRVLQALAANLGDRITFALVDHRDVGLLYERAIKELPNTLNDQQWGDLQRHYTPVAIAEKMLASLPLERIRPEERVIFDPAAGSGSLLLAATSRLASMNDIPEDINERQQYLANKVKGNDLDEYANLVTNLRYLLAKESLGKDIPFPCPESFTHKNYENLNREDLEIKPRVIVANPPFAEDEDTQRAAIFIKKALSWLDEGSQFSFVLPQSFLTNTTHGLATVRRLLTDRCQISDVWQLPAGAVGIDAEQDVCIISGIISNRKNWYPTIARAVFSRAKVSNTRNHGFLGTTWISKLNSENEDWSSIIIPDINIPVRTVPLGDLFYVFNGVTPTKKYKPVSECPPENECKLNWRMKWRDRNRLWADPNRINQQEKWIRYGKEFLHTPVLSNAYLFDQKKLLVGRKVNRGSIHPIAVQMDTTGLCPDNDVYCVLPIQQAGKSTYKYRPTGDYPEEWDNLSYEDQQLWLLGLLASRICNALSLIGRSTREITVLRLCNLPLPATVDYRIITITRQIVERDKNNFPIPEQDELREELDKVVAQSYGNPNWMEISRTGTPTGLPEWQNERTKPIMIVRGQVMKLSENNNEIFIYLNGLLDDEEEQWLPILPEMPGWALDGTVFEAELSEDIETFAELAQRPWAIRRFRHTSRPYLTDQELREKLLETIS